MTMPLNTQPIMARDKSPLMVNVHSIFYTIQGEGPFAGKPAVFIRLAGCNLQCPLCDTDYTSNVDRMEPTFVVQAIRNLVELHDISFPPEQLMVVITGGEPFRQQGLDLLIWELCHGITKNVQIETNGTMDVKKFENLGLASVVCSPKNHHVSRSLHNYITAYKYVLDADSVDPSDGLPTEALGNPLVGRLARPHIGYAGPVYLQPVDVQDPKENERHLQACVESCMRYGYQLTVQLHKLAGLE